MMPRESERQLTFTGLKKMYLFLTIFTGPTHFLQVIALGSVPFTLPKGRCRSHSLRVGAVHIAWMPLKCLV